MPIFVYDFFSALWESIAQEVNGIENLALRGLGRIGLGAFVIAIFAFIGYTLVVNWVLVAGAIGILALAEFVCQVGNY